MTPGVWGAETTACRRWTTNHTSYFATLYWPYLICICRTSLSREGHSNESHKCNLSAQFTKFHTEKKMAVAVVIVAFRGVYLQSDEEMLSE